MKSRYIRGFIAGGILGAAAGMLLMPEVDREVKRKIIENGKSIVENAAHIVPGYNPRNISH